MDTEWNVQLTVLIICEFDTYLFQDLKLRIILIELLNLTLIMSHDQVIQFAQLVTESMEHFGIIQTTSLLYLKFTFSKK